jgi:hypothetical protein
MPTTIGRVTICAIVALAAIAAVALVLAPR